LGSPAHANRENYNTAIGLPLTVLEASLGTRALVLEMAMRGLGQIRHLARISRPEVGVITNVGPVHLELVGDLERVAQAKAELIAELPSSASCVVPASEEALRPHLRSDVRLITFASANLIGPPAMEIDDDALAHVEAVSDASADVRVIQAEVTDAGLRADVVAGGDRAVLDFSFNQAHNLTNALAAIGAAHALGVPLAALAEGASAIRFSSLRGEEVELPGGGLIVNDCYNANPVSMRAAIDHLAELAARRTAKRVVAVLGEMRELGPDAERFHEEIGAHAAKAGVGVLIAVGPPSDGYLGGFGDAGEVYRVGDADEAAELLRGLVGPGDVVLVKASRAVGLEQVVEALV
jgi:UDP-N-acetylmuramoyl-tripeptide--D-alanyl-D-alanine ligase